MSARRNFSLLFTGVAFLRIKSPDISFFQYVVPTSLTVSSLLAYHLLEPYLRIELDGLVSSLSSLMIALIGFFVAALAAVATFGNASLDQVMQGITPTLLDKKITRRVFLTSIFGYCNLSSILLFLVGEFWIASKWTRDTPDFIETISPHVFAFVYLWISFSLLSAMLVGIHYLISRMHR